MCGFAIDKLPLVKMTKFRLIFYLFLCNLSIDKIPLCKLENFGIYFFYFLCNFSIDKNAYHVIYWNFAPQRVIGTRKRRAIIPHFSVLVNRQNVQKSKKYLYILLPNRMSIGRVHKHFPHTIHFFSVLPSGVLSIGRLHKYFLNFHANIAKNAKLCSSAFLTNFILFSW